MSTKEQIEVVQSELEAITDEHDSLVDMMSPEGSEADHDKRSERLSDMTQRIADLEDELSDLKLKAKQEQGQEVMDALQDEWKTKDIAGASVAEMQATVDRLAKAWQEAITQHDPLLNQLFEARARLAALKASQPARSETAR